MATERIRSAAADGDAAPAQADPARGAASDVDRELRAALDGDLARELRFWRARAEELEAQLATLHQRLLALTGHLPARYAPLLTCDAAVIERDRDWPDPRSGWKETIDLEPASVASELARLWQRLGPAAAR